MSEQYLEGILKYVRAAFVMAVLVIGLPALGRLVLIRWTQTAEVKKIAESDGVVFHSVTYLGDVYVTSTPKALTKSDSEKGQ